MDNTVDGR